MKFSKFGAKFTQDCGILHLMADLGEGVRQPGVLMLGGGNPSHIPELQAYFREQMERILRSGSEFEQLIGNYSGPDGEPHFLDALVELFNEEYDWKVSRKNVALTNGSQTAFFFLFNLFAGERERGGGKGKILLPITPEYIGYADLGIQEEIFSARRPQIELLDDRFFKYRVNFAGLEISKDIRAICVSRPTNPTGNVLTEEEMQRFSDLAVKHDVPLVIDNAYGTPFPGMIFTEAVPRWNDRTVMCLSLSKLGLPGARTGIVIAHEDVIDAIKGMNAVLSLAPGNFGAYLAADAVRSREILRLSKEVVRPHYETKLRNALKVVKEKFEGIEYYIHKPEGSMFLWLWFKGLPVTSEELYQRLKKRKVLIVPGHYFFPGLGDDWDHKQECIRVNFGGEPEMVAKGLAAIAEEVRTLVEAN